DDGGRIGPPAVATWFVRSPAGTLASPNGVPTPGRGPMLLIDNCQTPPARVAHSTVHNMFFSVIPRRPSPVEPNWTYSVIRPYAKNPFVTPQDLAQTLRQFDAVLWYHGTDKSPQPLLEAYQDTIGEYVRHGGRFYVEGLNLVDDPTLVVLHGKNPG